MADRLNGTPVPTHRGLADSRFVFAGNRIFVLEEMMARRFRTEILAVKGSHLERTLRMRGTRFTAIESKDHLISCLTSMDYDFFVANGCPFILPVSGLQGPGRGRTFINVHPGPLPDLRGIDPVPGALLLGKDSGAACHIMDDGIDTGPVISRVIIPNTADLDAGLLYQLSFMAEKEAFNIACDREFRPATDLAVRPTPGAYYSRKEADLMIDFNAPAEVTLRRIKAFSNKSQGARFRFYGAEFRVFDAEPVTNPYLLQKGGSCAHGEVVFRYEDCLLIRAGDIFLKLKAIEGDLSVIQPGDNLAHAESRGRARPPRAAAS